MGRILDSFPKKKGCKSVFSKVSLHSFRCVLGVKHDMGVYESSKFTNWIMFGSFKSLRSDVIKSKSVISESVRIV